jgi:hypothetical protein
VAKANDMLYVASTWRLQHRKELSASENVEAVFWAAAIEEEGEQEQDVVIVE